MMYQNTESVIQMQRNSFDEMMEDVCKELHLNYIGDIRIEQERIHVLSYLKRHDIEETQNDNYIKLLDYIGPKKEYM